MKHDPVVNVHDLHWVKVIAWRQLALLFKHIQLLKYSLYRGVKHFPLTVQQVEVEARDTNGIDGKHGKSQGHPEYTFRCCAAKMVVRL